jgi:hypothetical protein
MNKRTVLQKSPSRIFGQNRRNYPVFGRQRPETGFDRDCVAELAVQLAKFSALAAGKLADVEMKRTLSHLLTGPTQSQATAR